MTASADVHDASATASTLNFALGKRHVKSWMTDAINRAAVPAPALPTPSSLPSYPAFPVRRKRGRPRKHPLTEPVDQQHATGAVSNENSPTAAPPAEELPSSNSTSPQLANIFTEHTRSCSRGNLDIVVFPSPAPSEEDAQNGGLQILGPGTRQPVDLNGFDITPQISPSPSNPAPATTVRSPTRQQPQPSERPIGENSSPVQKRARINTVQHLASTAAVASPLGLPTSPESAWLPVPQAQHGSPSLAQASRHNHSFSHEVDAQAAFPQHMQTAEYFGRLPSSRSHPSPPQELFVHNVSGQQTYVSPQLATQPFGIFPDTQQIALPASVVPSQRRASNHDDWYTVDDCDHELRSLSAAYPGTLLNRTDARRLHILNEAVRRHDWAYLTLHQYYCLMTFRPQELPSSLQRNNALNVAHSLIQELLDDNSQLSPNVLAFFCTFPFTVNQLASTWPTRYQYAERQFAMFVDYSPYMGALRQASERRRVPPTPREFANCAITSLTIQRLLFKLILRVLWQGLPSAPEKSYFENQAVDTFNKAQSLFEQRRAAGELGGREQAVLELQNWNSRFYHINHLLKTSLQASLQGQRYQPTGPASSHPSQQQQLAPQRQTPTQHRSHATHDTSAFAMSRQQPLPPAMGPRRTSQTHPMPGSRRVSTALLPQPGHILPQQRVPSPFRFSLHQAHLRSPVLQVVSLTSPSFYSWQGFVHRPHRLKHANTAIERLSFMFSNKEIGFLASAVPTVPGAAETRLIGENCKTIRLRCVKWPADLAPRDELWAVEDSSWIPYSSFALNGKPLEVRKKIHNGKDLPVDLTGLVREGENVLEVSVMSDSDDDTFRKFMVAVEFLGTMTRTSIERRCREKTIPATTVISNIRRKLSPSAADDDDIVLIESTLTITLRDPFSAAKICDTPVRGETCRHNECFDLDTFLQTRPRKGDVTAADQWRCPICRADARPTSLVVDGFLVEVHKELERKGLLDTRAIVVSQDGSWKPKPEERDPTGVSDRDSPDPAPTTGLLAVRSRPTAFHDIIDLDSD